MSIKSPSQLSEIEELRQKLEEANDTLEAIRGGQVDAFVIKDGNGPRIYTLKSADQTYRVFIEKMIEGKAVIALTTDNAWVGFCYIEEWSHGEFVANSGLIVSPAFRKTGIAKQIKRRIFDLSRQKYPNSKIFGLTTGLAVMKINSDLGYEPVTYSELTQDETFWAGCKSCVNYDILMSKERKNCMCTAMLYDPKDHFAPEETTEDFKLRMLPGNHFFLHESQDVLLQILFRELHSIRNKQFGH